MSALTLPGIIFVLTLGGIFLGTLLRRTLPEHHLDGHAKDVVRLGVGLIATIAALVLGLLIARKGFVRYAEHACPAYHRLAGDHIRKLHSLFSPLNVTALTSLSLFALSAA